MYIHATVSHCVSSEHSHCRATPTPERLPTTLPVLVRVFNVQSMDSWHPALAICRHKNKQRRKQSRVCGVQEAVLLSSSGYSHDCTVHLTAQMGCLGHPLPSRKLLPSGTCFATVPHCHNRSLVEVHSLERRNAAAQYMMVVMIVTMLMMLMIVTVGWRPG